MNTLLHIKYMTCVCVCCRYDEQSTISTNVHTMHRTATFDAVDVEYGLCERVQMCVLNCACVCAHVCAEQMIMWSECNAIFLLIRCYIALIAVRENVYISSVNCIKFEMKIYFEERRMWSALGFVITTH